MENTAVFSKEVTNDHVLRPHLWESNISISILKHILYWLMQMQGNYVLVNDGENKQIL
jgi:hypothetical protein